MLISRAISIENENVNLDKGNQETASTCSDYLRASLIASGNKIKTMNIDPDFLIRKPYIGNPYVSYSNEVHYHNSPNNLYILTISHCWEYRMGSNACLFNLINNDGKIVEDFMPYTCGRRFSWSDDSKFLSVLINEKNEGVLIMDLVRHQFAFIRSRSRYFSFQNNSLCFTIPDKDIESMNSGRLLGGGSSELPRIKFIKPPDVFIPLDRLTFYDKNNLKNITENANDMQEVHLEPLREGFWPFYGKLPQNTWDGFNGREFEIYQLEAFANYGDEQSIKWLTEIKLLSKSRYNNGTTVSYYLGRRERE